MFLNWQRWWECELGFIKCVTLFIYSLSWVVYICFPRHLSRYSFFLFASYKRTKWLIILVLISKSNPLRLDIHPTRSHSFSLIALSFLSTFCLLRGKLLLLVVVFSNKLSNQSLFGWILLLFYFYVCWFLFRDNFSRRLTTSWRRFIRDTFCTSIVQCV